MGPIAVGIIIVLACIIVGLIGSLLAQKYDEGWHFLWIPVVFIGFFCGLWFIVLTPSDVRRGRAECRETAGIVEREYRTDHSAWSVKCEVLVDGEWKTLD